MEFGIGAAVALAVFGASTAIGFDRERAFYPVVLIVIASYYILFAAMGASGQIVLMESVVAAIFVLAAVVGFKSTLWLVAIAAAGHGLFDFVHHLIIDNPGVPSWWLGFCSTVDLIAGGYLAVLLLTRPGLSSRA